MSGARGQPKAGDRPDRRLTNRHHSEAFKRRVVAMHEAGTSIKQLCKRYRISSYSIWNWGKQYGQPGKHKRRGPYASHAVKPNGAVPNGLLEAVLDLEAAMTSLQGRALTSLSDAELYAVRALRTLRIVKENSHAASPTAPAKAKQ